MIYFVPEHGGTNPKFAEAFAKGSGLEITESREWVGGEWIGFGSPHNWESLRQARKAGVPWIYGDHGYFGRGEYYRVTRNAFQCDGVSGHGVGSAAIPEIAPWRRGNHVLVCPPHENIAVLMGFSVHDWLTDVAFRLTHNTDRTVKVRDRFADKPLAADLKDCHAVVTWTSNVAVDALIAGVPVFCTGECASSPMGRTDPINIEYPRYPDDRRAWLCVLACNQWTLDEIAEGKVWE